MHTGESLAREGPNDSDETGHAATRPGRGTARSSAAAGTLDRGYRGHDRRRTVPRGLPDRRHDDDPLLSGGLGVPAQPADHPGDQLVLVSPPGLADPPFHTPGGTDLRGTSPDALVESARGLREGRPDRDGGLSLGDQLARRGRLGARRAVRRTLGLSRRPAGRRRSSPEDRLAG